MELFISYINRNEGPQNSFLVVSVVLSSPLPLHINGAHPHTQFSHGC